MTTLTIRRPPKLDPVPVEADTLSDDDLMRAELYARHRAQQLTEHLAPFREDAHAGIDRFVAESARRIDAILAGNRHALVSKAQRPDIGGLADLWVVVNDPAIAERWHALMDNAPVGEFDPLSRAEKRVLADTLSTEAAALRAEQRRRAQEAAKEQVKAAARAAAKAARTTSRQQG